MTGVISTTTEETTDVRKMNRQFLHVLLSKMMNTMLCLNIASNYSVIAYLLLQNTEQKLLNPVIVNTFFTVLHDETYELPLFSRE